MPERDVLSALLNRINRESESPAGGMPLLSTWDAADRILGSDWLADHETAVRAEVRRAVADLLSLPAISTTAAAEGVISALVAIDLIELGLSRSGTEGSTDV